MTSTETYKRFELKLNSLANSDNVDISPGEYVLIYNEQQTKWYESKFRGRRTDVQLLAERDLPLTLVTTTDDFVEYSLPTNYLEYISTYCKTSRGICTDRRMRTFPVIDLSNKELYLRDDYNKPSFDYSETFTTIASDKMQVYKTDFSIDSVFLTYYRFPKYIDLLGYTRLDGVASTNIDPELSDEYVNEIIDWCVAEVQRSFGDTNGFQLSADRLNRDKNN